MIIAYVLYNLNCSTPVIDMDDLDKYELLGLKRNVNKHYGWKNQSANASLALFSKK